jgi:hypothetical protein
MGKILLLALIIVAVWFAFRTGARIQAKRMRTAARKGEIDRTTGKPVQPKADEAEEMRACAVCGAFVPVSGAQPCGKAGCPQGR